MIVLRVKKPEKRQSPFWLKEMDHLDNAEFVFDPFLVRDDPKCRMYRLHSGHTFLTPMDKGTFWTWSWNVNTKWLEVVSTDDEDLSELEKIGIKVPDAFKTNGPILLSNLQNYSK